VILEPKIFGDERGFFLESYNEATFGELGLPTRFVQDNHSSSRRGVLRGLHYQLKKPQGKVMRALRGEIFDVPGFGHGFLVLSESAEVAYKATEFYAPAFERSILWNDPAVAIDWPLLGEPILSEKDRAGLLLADAETYADSSSL
jgi:dTDP-4-dehydrorhamnose 3,5-epimerase